MLIKETVEGFLNKVASDEPAPGGGSVAALAGANGAGLFAMVCRLTIGREKYASVEADMKAALGELVPLQKRLIELIDEDTEAFNDVMSAFKMPKETDEEKEARKAQKSKEIKEIRLRPKTGEYDVAHKVRDARRFLKEGCKVKVRVRFRGREITHLEVARDLLERIAADLEDVGHVEQQPRLEGRTMLMILSPSSK